MVDSYTSYKIRVVSFYSLRGFLWVRDSVAYVYTYTRQTGARAMAHNRRENIDYVALHADRRRRRATRMTEDFERESHQVAVSAITESPCRERGSANPYRRLASNPPKGTYLGHRLVGPDDNSAQQKVCLVTYIPFYVRKCKERGCIFILLCVKFSTQTILTFPDIVVFRTSTFAVCWVVYIGIPVASKEDAR